ncbi:MAG TPA: ParB N-terminal domain-containing protein [Firmicutes bacterium]|nr:ParB N-terminal domain-containing protein [Bacillota bacterium]
MNTDRIGPKAIASGIPVYCSFDELADINTLVPNPRNPNRHPDRQIELLAKIIKAQGWRAPITVSNRSGFIVRGHGRLLAAQRLGVE